jgi:hypothetical protein
MENPTIVINNESGGGAGSWVGDAIPILKPLARALTILLLVVAVIAAVAALNILPAIAAVLSDLRNVLQAGGITGLLSWLFGLNPADEPADFRNLTAQEAAKLTAGNIWRNQPIALAYRFITGRKVFQFDLPN